MEKIFDPYFTTNPRGNDLGLAISRSIIKNHGGHSTAASEVGVGTTFYMWLPAAQKEAVTEDPDEMAKGNERTLLTDDMRVS